MSWQNAQDTYAAHAEKLMKYAGNYYLIKPMVIKYTTRGPEGPEALT